MRTAEVRAAGLVGGMRGDRPGRVAIAVPRSSLTWLLCVNLTRVTVSVVRWVLRHPLAATLLVLGALLLCTAGVLATSLVAVAGAVGLVVWSRRRPKSFRRLVVARWRRVWTYGRWWQAAMVTCELARQLDGREYLPRLRRVSCPSPCVDRLRVDLLSGQSPEDFERHSEQLAHTFAVERVRVTLERPGRIVLEVTRRDGLTQVVDPVTPAEAPDLTSLPVGRCEDGTEWTLRLLGTHLLVAGATGAGKGSVVWSLVRAVGPRVREGSVQLWAVDPKGGMELTPGAALFNRFAYGDTASMVGLLEDAVRLMRDRAERLRLAGVRSHTPSRGEPLVVVLVDEMAALTAYVGDRDLKRRAETALQLLLSQGRAPGVLVVAAVQDPGKDVIGFRDLFPSRVALRLLEDVQVDMVLGRAARQRGANCDQIPASLPGVGYVMVEGVREPVRVRASHITDEDLAAMVERYQPDDGPASLTLLGA